ncbi:MAG: Primosomal protein N' [Alphaproteobacteria bacterium MarineAlpha2_Bin1]|nr:MAG: Primosomal protein N' [Alphaproteobacteria bacterium MarineAlpha2_Bin1]
MITNKSRSNQQKIISVMVPYKIDGPFQYFAIQGTFFSPGDFVSVPFGKKTIIGVVWINHPKNKVDSSKLKTVIEKLDIPPISKDLLSLIEWVSDYTLCPLGSVLKLAMPPANFSISQNKKKLLSYEGKLPKRLTVGRSKVLNFLKRHPASSLEDIVKFTHVSKNIVKVLIRQGYVREKIVKEDRLFREEIFNETISKLTKDQLGVSKRIISEVNKNNFSVTLLDGVTGSGKTEVYFEAISEVIKKGNQTLIMLPEISLTEQWLEKFNRRFGSEPVVWHSNISKKERVNAWEKISKGKAKVVVGARSSLFLPFKYLGLIIIDEEHDLSYKQQENVIYNARDMAIVRAKILKKPILLVSATPSLETLYNVKVKKYGLLNLKERYGYAKLPNISIIDLNNEKLIANRWISNSLTEEINKCLLKKQQAMLFLNRRGYAPLTLCRKCGHRLECSNCSSWLVLHKSLNKMLCHHCDYSVNYPERCQKCDTENSLVLIGPGIERLSEEVSKIFPQAKQEVLSSDLLTNSKETAKSFERIKKGEVDIIIGTQVISKGHHFPYLTLVGVIDGDIGLVGGDIRANEKTFQLLYQVSGRAGRGDLEGLAFIQTYYPNYPVMQLIKKGLRDQFLDNELDNRKSNLMPPFGKLASVIISSPDENEAKVLAQKLAKIAPLRKDIKLLGPVSAPIKFLRGRHRFRLLLKAKKSAKIQAYIKDWILFNKYPKRVKVQIDIDPYTFL